MRQTKNSRSCTFYAGAFLIVKIIFLSGGRLRKGEKTNLFFFNHLFSNIYSRNGGRKTKKIKINSKAICKAIRFFSLSVGATAVCMIASLGFLYPQSYPGQEPPALEASVFNSNGSFQEKTQAVSEQPVPETMEVVPLGTVFGIKLFTDGVIVASLSDIYTENGICCPAADAGLKPGDYLLQADGMEIQNNAALASYIGKSQGQAIEFQVKRGDAVFEASVTPVFGQGAFLTGMWVRDSAAGIGTLTFYNPSTGTFAGLGHGICDMDTSGVMELKSGQPAAISLCGIVKGEINEPGRLKGYFTQEGDLGRLLANNETGVYGTLSEAPSGQAVEILKKEDVRCGEVQILATIDQNGPQLYDAVIQRIGAKNQRTKNLILEITDPRLLESTGGIVQGMSGCPIFQDGKLAGAVTHVFTEEPNTGYGIFAQTMWEESVIFGMSK